MVQHGVFQLQHVRFVHVGEHEIDREGLFLRRTRTVQLCGHRREEQIERNVLEDRCPVFHTHGRNRAAVAQLVRAGEVGAAPHAGLGLVAELVVGACQQFLCLGVVGLGEHEVVEQARRPAVIARRDGGLCFCLQRCCATHGLDIAFSEFLGWQRVEVGGIRVVPAEVELVHGFGVVAQRAVVTAVGELRGELRRELELLRDLARRCALVGEAQCLVVRVAIGVALALEETDGAFVAEDRPVVAGEDDFHVAETADGFIDVAAPLERIAHLGAAQRVEVVHGAVHDLGTAPGLPCRQVEGEFRGRLGFRGVLEHELHPVDLHLLRCAVDALGGQPETRGAAQRLSPQA